MEFQCGCAVFHTAEMAHLKVMSVLVLVAVVGVFSFISALGFVSGSAPHCCPFLPVE